MGQGAVGGEAGIIPAKLLNLQLEPNSSTGYWGAIHEVDFIFSAENNGGEQERNRQAEEQLHVRTVRLFCSFKKGKFELPKINLLHLPPICCSAPRFEEIQSRGRMQSMRNRGGWRSARFGASRFSSSPLRPSYGFPWRSRACTASSTINSKYLFTRAISTNPPSTSRHYVVLLRPTRSTIPYLTTPR